MATVDKCRRTECRYNDGVDRCTLEEIELDECAQCDSFNDLVADSGDKRVDGGY